jgi:hypothetical protein
MIVQMTAARAPAASLPEKSQFLRLCGAPHNHDGLSITWWQFSFGWKKKRHQYRRYEVTIGRDVLNDWTVSIRYGSPGQGGLELRSAAARPEETRSFLP